MKNFSLKAKLLSLSIFLVSISVVLGGVSYWSIKSVIKEYSVISDVSFPNATNMLQMFSNFRMARIEAFQFTSPTTSEAVNDKAVEAILKGIETDKDLQKKYEAVEFLPGEAELYKEFRKHIDAGYERIGKMANDYKGGKKDAASLEQMRHVLESEIMDIGAKGRDAMHKLREFHYDFAEKAEANAKSTGEMAITVSVALVLILGFLGIAASLLFSNSLTKSLKAISDALDESSTQVSSAAGKSLHLQKNFHKLQLSRPLHLKRLQHQ